MPGQFVDVGKTVTIANNLQFLKGTCMVAGLHKFSGKQIPLRSDTLLAIEVKSVSRNRTLPGIAAYDKAQLFTGELLVGG